VFVRVLEAVRGAMVMPCVLEVFMNYFVGSITTVLANGAIQLLYDHWRRRLSAAIVVIRFLDKNGLVSLLE
jgi:hypothetical protein